MIRLTLLFLVCWPLLSQQGGGGGGSSSSLPAVLDPRPLLTNPIKPASAATNIGSGATLALLSVTGAGTLERIQYASVITTGGSNPNSLGSDALISIVADGVTVLNCSTGIFFNTYGYDGGNSNYQGGTAGQFFRTKNIGVDYYADGQYYGAERSILVHYKTSMVVNVTNTGTATGQIYSGVDYRVGAAPAGLYNPRYNVFHSVYTAFTTVASTAGTVFNPLPSVSPGYPGLLDSITVFMYGAASGPYWLEGHPKVTVDGNLGPTQNGTEDFFGSHFYFHNPTHSDEMGVGYIGLSVSQVNYYTGMYRFFRIQPCYFNTSIAFSMENGHSGEQGAGATVQILYASLVIYYTTK